MHRVSDEGDGIPPDDLERIFDKFYRVQAADRQRAGTGLGLRSAAASSRPWAARSSPRNRPDRRGAVFTIDLADRRPSCVPRRPRHERGAAARILVVDDEPAIRRFLRTEPDARRAMTSSKPATGDAALDAAATRGDRDPRASTSACPTSTARGHPPIAARADACRSSCCPAAATKRGKVEALDLGADDYRDQAVRHRRTAGPHPRRAAPPPAAGGRAAGLPQRRPDGRSGAPDRHRARARR